MGKTGFCYAAITRPWKPLRQIGMIRMGDKIRKGMTVFKGTVCLDEYRVIAVNGSMAWVRSCDVEAWDMDVIVKLSELSRDRSEFLKNRVVDQRKQVDYAKMKLSNEEERLRMYVSAEQEDK
jgi:hypothetical protein